MNYRLERVDVRMLLELATRVLTVGSVLLVSTSDQPTMIVAVVPNFEREIPTMGIGIFHT